MAINCVFAIYPERILNIVAEFLNCLIILVDHNRYAGQLRFICVKVEQRSIEGYIVIHILDHRARTRHVRFNTERISVRKLRSIINTDF